VYLPVFSSIFCPVNKIEHVQFTKQLNGFNAFNDLDDDECVVVYKLS